MHIQRIEIANVLGLARADITITSPLLMVAGSNEAGKSSIADAISMAILGQPRRVKLKKELGLLLHGDAKKGRVTVVANGEAFGSYLLPSGEHTAPDPFAGAEYLQYVLDAGLFARLEPADRKAMLFKITKCKVNPNEVEKQLIKAGANAEYAEEVKPMLLNGFPAAAKSAAEAATMAKGAYRQVTAENWGAVQSEGWTVEIPELGEGIDEPTESDLKVAQQEQADAAVQIEKGNQFLGNLNARIDAANSWYQRKEQLENSAKDVDAARAKLINTEEMLAEWEPKLAELTAAVLAYNGESSCECPSCHVKLKVVGQAVELFKGKTADLKKLKEAQDELKKASDAVNMLESTKSNDKARIDKALAASAQLVEHLKIQPESATQADINRCEAALQVQRDIRTKAEAKAVMIRERMDLIEGAEQRQADARKHHECVKSWLLIAEQLKPDGIPAKILQNAITPLNDSIAILAGIAGWKKVQLTEDMSIIVEGRPYGLISESAKWRADTLISLAIAQMSELKLIVLDRFDVLDQKGRGQLIAMLLKLGELKAMDTMIICGTLKALPERQVPGMSTLWIQNAIAE